MDLSFSILQHAFYNPAQGVGLFSNYEYIASIC